MRKIERNRCILGLIGVILMLCSGFFKHDIPRNYNIVLLILGNIIGVIPVIRQLLDEFRN